MAGELSLSTSRWRFAAHLGIWSAEHPLLAATAGSVDPVTQIACAAELGFAGITDNCLMLRDAETQRRMGAALRQYGLSMGTFTCAPPGYAASIRWGEPVADMPAAIADVLAAADRLGGGCINAVLLDAGTPADEQLAHAAENLARAAEIAAAAGFPLALEAVSLARVPNALIGRAEETMALVRNSGAPHLGLVLDLCHCHCAGDDMAALIRVHADRLMAIQIADMPGRVQPGAGTIAMAPVMTALAEIGWQGLVEAEFNPAPPGAEGEAAAIAALHRMAGADISPHPPAQSVAAKRPSPPA